MASIGDLFLAIRAETGQFEADLTKSAAASGDKAAEKFSAAFGRKAKTAIAAGIAGVFAVATRDAVDLDNALRKVAASSGIAESEMAGFQSTVMGLFKANPTKGFEEIAATIGTLKTDLGLTTEEAGKAAQAFLNFSKVTGQDGTAAVKGLDDILDAFNLDASDSGRIMDLLVASQQKYGGTVSESQAALSTLAPSLKALNVGLEDGVGLLNLFQTTGLDASAATAALKKAVDGLKPGETLNDLITQISSIEDPTLRAQKAIDIFGARGGVGLANAFRPGITSLDEFKLSMDETTGAVVAGAAKIDDSFQNKITGAFRTFIAGPLADLGPAVLSAVSTFAGLATALVAMGVSLDILKAKVTQTFDLINARAAALLGVLGLLTYALTNTEGSEARSEAEKLGEAYRSAADEAKRFGAAVGHTVTVVGGATQAYLASERAALKLAGGIGTTTDSTDALTGATDDETDALGTNYAAMLKAREETLTAAKAQATLKKFTDLASDSAAEANNNLLDFASGANTAANDANTAATAARTLQSALAAIERNILVQIQYKVSTAPFINPRAQPGTADADRRNAFSSGGDQGALDQANANFLARDRIAKEIAAEKARLAKIGSSGAAAKADRDAAAAAKEHAAALREKLTSALQTAKDGALDYFSRIHEASAKAIRDSAERTKKEIDDARARIRAHLDEVRATAEAPVTAAEDAQRAIEDARTLRDLQERLAEAQASGDAGGIRSAEEALQSENARRAINALRTTAAATVAAATLEAKAAEDKLIARQNALDLETKALLTAEDERYALQKKNFERDFKALSDHLTDGKRTHAQINAEIAKLYQGFGEDLGVKFAAGLIASKKAVEQAATELADVVRKYLKTDSPAQLGPLRRTSPEQMGAGVGRQWGKGVVKEILGFAAEVGQAVRSVMPTVYAAPSLAYAAAGAPMAPGARLDAAMGSGGGRSIEVNVYNPAPEPASQSVEERLRIGAATGVW